MNWQEFIDGFRKFDYENLDFENMGSWPLGVKLVACMLLAAAIAAGGYYGLVKGKFEQLDREARKEVDLKTQYEDKAFKVANLDAFKIQLAEMQDTFGALLEQLPNETEISGLLDDITFTGVQSGLDFESLALGQEIPAELFIETPIDISARGGYHELGTFVSGIAALPRIVTLHNFTITRAKQSGDDESDSKAPLLMSVKAKTYRYKPGGGQ